MAGADAQTRMMERLLADPVFRARFRKDPAGVAREEGADEVADELSVVRDPMQTLDFRESRSSVAGVMIAAAVEGIGIYELGKHILPHLEDAQAATGSPASSGGASQGWDPSQFGAGGSGGSPSEETLTLLQNKNVHFDSVGLADMNAGRMDPRVVSVLGAIAEKHRISISSTASDHPKLTTGGSVSNHYYGRAFDIATVDGKPVSPGNSAARQLALQLSSVDSRIRPSEIGSPWAIPGAAYFTDGAHQDHVHVGFDNPIPADWSPPADPASSPPGDPASSPPADPASSPAADPASLPARALAAAQAPSAPPSPDSGGDENEPDENSAGYDNWDETHSSGSPEDSSGSGDDGSSESGSGEDSGGDGNDGSDGASDGQSAQDASPSAGDALQVPDVAGGYPGDNASQAEVAAWMASAAQKRGLPAELPVMASLVESGMKNLHGGDADSVGFFQMRVGVWNNGAYSGYPDKPELQLKWFLDHAAAVKKQRVASGQPVDDPKHYGDWIADVERPAAQYRGRYQQQLDEAQALLKQAGGKRGGGNGLDLVDSGSGSQAGRRAVTALAEAKKQLGTPYHWGGSNPKTGFDCSGLMQWAYAKAGIRIPRVSEQQILAANGTPVSRKHLLPGDLVFFRDSTGDVHHVGMSLGGDKFINAPHTGDVVKYASLKEPYYAQQFAGGRRFDKPAAAAEQLRAASQGSGSGGSGSGSAESEAARLARAALDRDAAEVQRSDSELFKALARQEGHQPNEVQFLKAVGPAP